MMSERRNKAKQKLKKQPKFEVESTAAVGKPRFVVPTRRNRTKQTKTSSYTPKRSQTPSLIKEMGKSALYGFFPYRAASCGILIACIGLLYYMGIRQEFYLNNIPVSGLQRITASEIIAESGLADKHIFAIDPVEAAQQIHENVGGVIAAEVALSWPQQVTIKVEEDEPVAVIDYGGQQQWADIDGKLFPKRTAESGLIYIRTEKELTTDSVPAEVIDAALSLNKLRSNLTSFTYQPGPGLVFAEETGDWTVAVGTGNDMHQKLIMYNAIANNLLSRDMVIEYIDVSDLGKPYYRAAKLDIEAVPSP